MLKCIRDIFIKSFSSFGEYLSLFIDVIWVSIKRPPPWSLLKDQFYNIGVLSIIVVSITGASTGIVLAAQSIYQLSSKGLAGVTGIMVAKAMITELGPVLTALMVTGRVGSAMCAELGTMRVTEQIAALQSMAVNPKRYLIAPRFIAGVLMVPLLTMYSILLGIIGGYVISSFYFGMPATNYFDPMPTHVTLFDLVTGLVKATFFGIMLVTICCYKGMKTRGGAEGVGKSTTSSVVISYVTILISDFLITMGLNSFYQATHGGRLP